MHIILCVQICLCFLSHFPLSHIFNPACQRLMMAAVESRKIHSCDYTAHSRVSGSGNARGRIPSFSAPYLRQPLMLPLLPETRNGVRSLYKCHIIQMMARERERKSDEMPLLHCVHKLAVSEASDVHPYRFIIYTQKKTPHRLASSLFGLFGL